MCIYIYDDTHVCYVCITEHVIIYNTIKNLITIKKYIHTCIHA